MTVLEKDIKSRSYQKSIIHLEDQIKEKTNELSLVISRRDSLNNEMEKFHLDKIKLEKDKREFDLSKHNRRKELEEIESEFDPKRELHLSDLESIKRQIRESTRELGRINDSCIRGEAEISKKKIEIDSLEEEIIELTNLVIRHEEMKVKYSKISEETSKALEMLQNIRENSIIEIRNKDIIIERLENEAKELEVRKEAAEFELKKYTDNLYTAMNDWQIIRDRLEVRWQKEFPELRLPLTM